MEAGKHLGRPPRGKSKSKANYEPARILRLLLVRRRQRDGTARRPKLNDLEAGAVRKIVRFADRLGR